MMTAYFAIDRQTMANGCIKMLKGSNHLGRIDHGSCSSSLCSLRLFTSKNLLHRVNYVNWLGTQKKRLQTLTAAQEGPMYGPGEGGGLDASLRH